MQRTVSARRLPLASLVIALAGATLGASVAEAAATSANLISITALSAATSLDLTGLATTGGIATRGDLLLANDGNFYAATSGGGTGSVGAIMRFTPAGAATVLHSLTSGTEGAVPYAGPIQAADGNLYGTTYLGGTKAQGTVYRMALDGTFATLYTFSSDAKGAFYPYGGLLQGPDGALYGTTLRGGTNDAGTVFRITLDGTLSVLHSFNGSDGKNPESDLVLGNDGALYGTTLLGGTADRGTVFKITPTGTLTSLYSFAALGAFNTLGVATNATGSNPRAGLRLGADGNFYGTAYQGGTGGYGTVFKITPAGVLTTLHAFTGSPGDGASPLSKVTQGPDGSLYGTAEKGGYNGSGMAWRINAANQYALLHSFTAQAEDGGTPYATLLPYNGFVYGISFTDSIGSAGALFKLDEGSGGVLPVAFGLTADTLTLGSSATLTWSSPTAATCTASAGWTDTIATAGTKVITPSVAGVYNYILSCTDGAGVIRNAYASMYVTAPAAQSVDGGGTGGGGAVSLLALGLLGGAAGSLARRRYKSAVT